MQSTTALRLAYRNGAKTIEAYDVIGQLKRRVHNGICCSSQRPATHTPLRVGHARSIQVRRLASMAFPSVVLLALLLSPHLRAEEDEGADAYRGPWVQVFAIHTGPYPLSPPPGSDRDRAMVQVYSYDRSSETWKRSPMVWATIGELIAYSQSRLDVEPRTEERVITPLRVIDIFRRRVLIDVAKRSQPIVIVASFVRIRNEDTGAEMEFATYRAHSEVTRAMDWLRENGPR